MAALEKIQEAENQEKSERLVRALSDVEDFFLHKKEGELYEFLLNVVEKPLIENILCKTEGNQIRTAKILGINRNTLRMKIKKLNINVERFRY